MKIQQTMAAPRPSRLPSHSRVPREEAGPADSYQPSLLGRCARAAGREVGRVALIGAGYAGLTAAGALLGIPGVLLAGGAAALAHGVVAHKSEDLSMSVKLGAAGGVLGMTAATMGGLWGLGGAAGPGIALMGVYVASLAASSRLMEVLLP